MGTQTRSALRSFQQKSRLRVDGQPGPQTDDALVRAGAIPFAIAALGQVAANIGSGLASVFRPFANIFTTPSPQAVALQALRPLVAAATAATEANAFAIMQAVCQFMNIPWRLGYTILEHEGGVRLFNHGDGVMQTTRGARNHNIPLIPRDLKLTLLGLPLADQTPDATLERSLHTEFGRRLAVQIATGVMELSEGLRKFNGYAALAFIAYNAGSGWAYYIATEGQRQSKPPGITAAQWEDRCRVGAGRLHQSPAAVQVATAVWQCDSNMPGWFKHMAVTDVPSGLQLIAYQYLRSINVCIRQQAPAAAQCNAATHAQRQPGTGNQVCRPTRVGSLDKLYDPQRLGAGYRQAAQGQLPAITDDNLPIKAVNRDLFKIPAPPAAPIAV
jgi:hypothetical protein